MRVELWRPTKGPATVVMVTAVTPVMHALSLCSAIENGQINIVFPLLFSSSSSSKTNHHHHCCYKIQVFQKYNCAPHAGLRVIWSTHPSCLWRSYRTFRWLDRIHRRACSHVDRGQQPIGKQKLRTDCSTCRRGRKACSSTNYFLSACFPTRAMWENLFVHPTCLLPLISTVISLQSVRSSSVKG